MVICAGSGGVGKTTTAAAVALGLAERGAKVAVVTIDPARRLANALGLDTLEQRAAPGRDRRRRRRAVGDDARRQADVRSADRAPGAGRAHARRGVRRTGSTSSSRARSPARRSSRRSRSSTSSTRSGEFDVLVLDTPPARNALDFLDAPGRLTRFFQGRAIRMFLAPAGLSGRILGRGTGVVFGVLQRVTGVDLLRDLSVFFRSLGGMIDGFTERARRVGALLEDPATTFLIVSAPRHDPVEEAIFFHRKLRDAGMPFGGLVVNRVHQPPRRTRCRRRSPRGSARRWPSACRSRPRELAALAARDAANVRAAARRARRSADDRRPRARRTTCTTSRASPSCAHTCSSVVRVVGEPRAAPGRGGRRARRAGPRAGSRRARRRAPRPRATGGRSPTIAARSSEIASRTRCSSAGALVRLGADRGEPLGDVRRSRGDRCRRTARGRRAASRSAPRRRCRARSRARSGAAPRPARRRAACGAATSPQNARSGSSSSAASRQSPGGRRSRWRAGRPSRCCRRCGPRPSGRARARRRPTAAARSAAGAGGGRRPRARGRRRAWSRARARRPSRAGPRAARRGRRSSVVARTRLSPSPSGTSSDSITRPSTGVITTHSA